MIINNHDKKKSRKEIEQQARQKADAYWNKDCWIDIQIINERMYIRNLTTSELLIFNITALADKKK
jgi:hypothetical protein